MIDARGYSCPEPVIMAQKALESKESRYEMMVDTKTAVENVSRYVSQNGYRVDVSSSGDEYIMVFTKL